MRICRRPIFHRSLAALFAFVITGCGGESPAGIQQAAAQTALVSFPEELDPNCGDGRAQLFDHCTDQLELYESALARARDENKVLLVSFGAEWCIWCHVFDRYVNGYYNEFTYRYGSGEDSEFYSDTLFERAERDVSNDARELAEFVAQHFVLVHIDYHQAPNGDAVVSMNGAWEHFQNWLPFIYSVDASGRFAATFEHERVQYRRDSADWYRGYDRVELLSALRELYDAATPDSGG